MSFLKLSKFFLYLVPFSVVLVYQGTIFPFIVGKYVFFRTVVDLALVFFVWHWATTRTGTDYTRTYTDKTQIEKNKKQLSVVGHWSLVSPLAVAVSLFFLIFVLAGFFGVNPHASFWSNFERGEGVFQIIYLFIFFILLGLTFKDEKSWRKMFVVSFWAGISVILYGIAAAMGIGNFVGSNLCTRFAGSLGNPAYTGTYLIFAIFYAAYLANEEISRGKKWFWFSLTAPFFIFLLLTQTRGALLGLGVAIILGLFYLFFLLSKGKIKNIVLATAILLIVSGFLGFHFRRSINITPFCPAESGGNRILDVDFKTENFQTRLLLWKESIEAFKEWPILGWGPENFTVAFEKYYDPYFTTWYDRAHNIFFDYLVMTGLLGLVSFLGIFGVYFWQFFKTRTNTDYTRTNTEKEKKQKLLYEDLTYKIRGIIFKVKKELGLGHKESIYQKAIENEFRNNGLAFEKEKSIDIKYGNDKVGVYRPDFVVDNKVILELKALPSIGRFEKKQIWNYLKGSNYKLALLVNFGREDIEIERFIYDGHYKSIISPYKSASSLYESALMFALPIAYLVQGLVLFDVLPIYINLFLFLAFANYKFGKQQLVTGN